MTTADIERIASERLVLISEANAACQASGKTLEELLCEISVGVAQRFLARQATFVYCDAVMNGLHDVTLLTTEGRVASEIAWAVFLAFDAGEFIPPSDPADTDPVEKYTRSQLIAVLREFERNERPPFSRYAAVVRTGWLMNSGLLVYVEVDSDKKMQRVSVRKFYTGI